MEDKIAHCALNHYETVLHPTKGKPQDKEWTVYAAIVAQKEEQHEHDNRLWVVSCATGTKCSNFVPPPTPEEESVDANEQSLLQAESCVLRDCHAETLARRGLMHVLWTEIQSHLGGDDQQCLVKCRNQLLELDHSKNNEEENGKPQFRLRTTIKLHLYVSDSPCGDASIYPLADPKSVHDTTEDKHLHKESKRIKLSDINFTGAKVIVSNQTGVVASDCGGNHQILQTGTRQTNNQQQSTQESCIPICVAREEVQLLGRLRTKSGRSNLPSHLRSSCMSCSDKLVRWNVLGIQGSLLSRYIPHPIRLSSIVVSRDLRALSIEDQQEALARATQRRIVAVLEHVRTHLDQHKISLESNNILHYMELIEDLQVHIVPQSFARSKSTMEYHRWNATKEAESHTNDNPETIGRPKRKRDLSSMIKMDTPCGLSIHWDVNMQGHHVELIVGARGLCQGKKPKKLHDYPRLASRLSRHTLLAMARSMHDRYHKKDNNKPYPVTEFDHAKRQQFEPRTYKEWKHAIGDDTVRQLRSIIFSGGPLEGWLTS